MVRLQVLGMQRSRLSIQPQHALSNTLGIIDQLSPPKPYPVRSSAERGLERANHSRALRSLGAAQSCDRGARQTGSKIARYHPSTTVKPLRSVAVDLSFFLFGDCYPKMHRCGGQSPSHFCSHRKHLFHRSLVTARVIRALGALHCM